MRIDCRHGFFILTETKSGELARFQSLFGLMLKPYGDAYTFERLANTPKISIKGRPFMDTTATATFCGEPWQIFEKNGFVFDFTRNLVVPITSIQLTTRIDLGVYYYVSSGLLLPGSIVGDGDRVRDYSAWFHFDNQRFRYSEVRLA